MAKVLVILVVALVLEAMGVVFLSKGLRQIPGVERISVAEIVRVAKEGLSNGYFLLGVLFEAVFFAALLYLISKSDVSFVWPLTSLGFVLTTLAARFILHEHVSAMRWLGVFLIMVGAAVVSWTEHQKTVARPGSQPRDSATAVERSD
ncbi:MAG: DMT family transporter [Verrucomicrobiae bacterium]|nr:DMT family transporter [Verrucomicrobiae bacterium]